MFDFNALDHYFYFQIKIFLLLSFLSFWFEKQFYQKLNFNVNPNVKWI